MEMDFHTDILRLPKWLYYLLVFRFWGGSTLGKTQDWRSRRYGIWQSQRFSALKVEIFKINQVSLQEMTDTIKFRAITELPDNYYFIWTSRDNKSKSEIKTVV